MGFASLTDQLETDHPLPPEQYDRGELSIRSGKWSLLQMGLQQRLGDDPANFFDPDEVVLLVLNDHRRARCDYYTDEGTHIPLRIAGLKNHALIILPKGETVPTHYHPRNLFQRWIGPRDRQLSEALQQSWRANGNSGNWDAALIFKDATADPTKRYEYRYEATHGQDDYRFKLKDADYVVWLWELGKEEPQLLNGGNPIHILSEDETGGPQNGDGSLPFPPK
jgi:hypothetical protein